jgi:hypothetical protein
MCDHELTKKEQSYNTITTTHCHVRLCDKCNFMGLIFGQVRTEFNPGQIHRLLLHLIGEISFLKLKIHELQKDSFRSLGS